MPYLGILEEELVLMGFSQQVVRVNFPCQGFVAVVDRSITETLERATAERLTSRIADGVVPQPTILRLSSLA